MDETAVSVRGGLHYLYRAVDSTKLLASSVHLCAADNSSSNLRTCASSALRSASYSALAGGTPDHFSSGFNNSVGLGTMIEI